MDPTLAWARGLFRRYYRREPVYLPPRFGRREYGFLFLAQKGMVRHTAFQTREELARFLADRGPSHTYYSAAYYEQPDATDMQAKGWMGADLIFDLDADHLPDIEGLSFQEILERVRDEAVKIVDEFLLGHFAFRASDMRIAFSGGRGYHIHVTHPEVHTLDSAARREIVDYVTGNGLDVERLVHRRTFASDEVAGHVSRQQRWELPTADAPGWPGHFTRTLVGELDRIRQLEHDAAVDELVSLNGVGEKKAELLLQQLTPERVRRVRSGRVDHIPGLSDKRVLTALAERTRVAAIGEADEPVTADIKRLIRLPGSLHGKTGLRVTPMTVDGLKDFDPLVDAVALSREPVNIVVERPVEADLLGEHHAFEPGTHEVPEALAAFLVLRRQAKVVPGEVPA